MSQPTNVKKSNAGAWIVGILVLAAIGGGVGAHGASSSGSNSASSSSSSSSADSSTYGGTSNSSYSTDTSEPTDCIAADNVYDKMIAEGEDNISGAELSAWLVLQDNCKKAGGHPEGAGTAP
jgi:hypothetical protein